PRRVGEGEDRGEPNFVEKRERLLEVLLRLAGETDDDVGREREMGNRRAKLVDESEIESAVVLPLHPAEHAVRPRLNWQVKRRTDRRGVGHGTDEVRVEVPRMRRHEAEASQALDGTRRAGERAEA